MRRLALAALAVGLLVAGCGGSSSPRPAVASYLQQVNKIETELATPLSTVSVTGSEFAKLESARGRQPNIGVYEAQNRQLLGALAQIQALRRKLIALDAPPPAAHLRSLLIQVVTLQAKLTHEAARLVLFLPRFTAELQPLGPATRRLEAALSQQTVVGSAGVAAVYASKAAALRQFKATLDSVLARLRGLYAPSVSRPEYESQLRALAGMSTSAGQLAGALTGGPQGNIRELLLQFDKAAASNQTLAAQRAQIAAVKSYDAEQASLSKLTQAAELERLRLQNTLS
jgi:hypothetical protein